MLISSSVASSVHVFFCWRIWIIRPAYRWLVYVVGVVRLFLQSPYLMVNVSRTDISTSVGHGNPERHRCNYNWYFLRQRIHLNSCLHRAYSQEHRDSTQHRLFQYAQVPMIVSLNKHNFSDLAWRLKLVQRPDHHCDDVYREQFSAALSSYDLLLTLLQFLQVGMQTVMGEAPVVAKLVMLTLETGMLTSLGTLLELLLFAIFPNNSMHFLL